MAKFISQLRKTTNMSILNLAKCHFLNLIFAGFSMLNFFWDTSVARRISIIKQCIKCLISVACLIRLRRMYQNYHFNVAVEGVSKISFQCGSRDAKFCVSTIWLDKLLMLNVLYVVANIETRHVTSLPMAKSHFDTPSTTGLVNYLILSIL